MPGCYVPGCKSGYTKRDGSHLFRPRKKDLYRWNGIIQRIDRELSENDRICELHFSDDMLVKTDTFIIQGKRVELERVRWKLAENAVPHIFPTVSRSMSFQPEKMNTESLMLPQIKTDPELIISHEQDKVQEIKKEQEVEHLDIKQEYEDVDVTNDPAPEMSSCVTIKEELPFTISDGHGSETASYEEIAPDAVEMLQDHSLQETPYSCHYCNKSFSQKRYLRTHMNLHIGEKPFSCKECSKKFSNISNLWKHSQIHTGVTAVEMLQHHTSQETSYSCNYCNKSFSQRRYLKTHMNIHTGEKPFSCKECGKQFSNTSNLLTHSQIHSGVKAYSCNHCSKSFSRKSRLKVHLEGHMGEKLYSCEKKFSNELLRTHITKHSNDEPFICDQCGKCFSKKSDLKNHSYIHTNITPFSCHECHKYFPRRSNLYNHMRVHSGVKPFKCDECGKAFSGKTVFDSHKLSHAGIKPFSCSLCCKLFTQKSSLLRHSRQHME